MSSLSGTTSACFLNEFVGRQSFRSFSLCCCKHEEVQEPWFHSAFVAASTRKRKRRGFNCKFYHPAIPRPIQVSHSAQFELNGSWSWPPLTSSDVSQVCSMPGLQCAISLTSLRYSVASLFSVVVSSIALASQVCNWSVSLDWSCFSPVLTIQYIYPPHPPQGGESRSS